ncbi:MAG: hypothetical protein H6839_11100 [Planctomycetes bacterium]|nr:hypothetical protein [Planctomycetota bacterium]
MKRTPLWTGILALWLIAMAAGVWFAVADDRAPAASKAPVAKPIDQAARADADPLEQQGRHVVLPMDVGPAEQPEVAPTKSAETEAADKATADAVADKRTEPASSRESALAGEGKTTIAERRQIHNVDVGSGGTVQLPSGEVSIDGDLTIAEGGSLAAAGTTLVLDGENQTLSGTATAGKIIMRGGTKRIRGSFGTTSSANADPGKAQLYVEAGTTLVIEKGGKWNTPNPYGFQIAGDLVIDGGEFNCRFSNGNGTDRGEESWIAGSTLTIYSGKFIGNGDADFSGATITIHDGALEINDDIWNSGDALNMYGGTMRNTTGGGMFYLTGNVNIRDGKLQVYQNYTRSLRFAKDASIYCTGGEISINGSSATSDDGGILLASSATVPNLTINTSTKIHKASAPEAFLSVSGDLNIAKGQRFEAKGFNVIASYLQTDEQGEFIP